MSKFDRYVRNLPKVYKPKTNPTWRALLKALSASDDEITTQIQNTKDQLFVKTATGKDLDRLGSSVGVRRPSSLGLFDDDFRNLIPNLSFKPKQIRKAFYDTLDVFYGPLFSRASVQTSNSEPFNVSPGDILKVKIDNEEEPQKVKAFANDIQNPGSATAEEIVNILSRVNRSTPSIIEDPSTNNKFVNLRTNTPGLRGSVEFVPSSMIGSSKLDFSLQKIRITDQKQRTITYQVNQKELVIEIPAILPIVRRTLRGSHHFHASSALESNRSWRGSFLYSETQPNYTLTSQKATLQQNIFKGEVLTSINVTGADDIPNEPGKMIFSFGTEREEVPVNYISIPNDNTILVDPAHVFQKDHNSGDNINVILDSERPYNPRRSGQDLAVYLTSSSDAREIVQNILKELRAAGVVIRFEIILPDYQYIQNNPYSS